MRALLTGANSGIGYALLEFLIEKDYEVVALDCAIDNLGKVHSNNLSYKKIDLSNMEELLDWLNSIEQAFDVTINCAGIREIESVLTLSKEKWDQVMAVNLTAPFLISQRVANLAIESEIRANIINISSISGLMADPNRAAYVSSKHGIIGLTREMALELGSYGIRVNAVAPGIVQTELTNSYFSDDQMVSLIKKNTPLNRWGMPKHIVQAVDYIINNNYMTGSTLVVDGGWTAGKLL